MILKLEDSLTISKHLRPTDYAMPIEASMDGDLLLLSGKDGGVEIYLTHKEARAIMRLFDVAESED